MPTSRLSWVRTSSPAGQGLPNPTNHPTRREDAAAAALRMAAAEDKALSIENFAEVAMFRATTSRTERLVIPPGWVLDPVNLWLIESSIYFRRHT